MAPGKPNFVAIGSGVSAPQMRYFAVPFDVTIVFYVRFFGSSIRLQPTCTLERIFMQNTLKEVVPGKEVPFGDPDNYI